MILRVDSPGFTLVALEILGSPLFDLPDSVRQAHCTDAGEVRLAWSVVDVADLLSTPLPVALGQPPFVDGVVGVEAVCSGGRHNLPDRAFPALGSR